MSLSRARSRSYSSAVIASRLLVHHQEAIEAGQADQVGRQGGAGHIGVVLRQPAGELHRVVGVQHRHRRRRGRQLLGLQVAAEVGQRRPYVSTVLPDRPISSSSRYIPMAPSTVRSGVGGWGLGVGGWSSAIAGSGSVGGRSRSGCPRWRSRHHVSTQSRFTPQLSSRPDSHLGNSWASAELATTRCAPAWRAPLSVAPSRCGPKAKTGTPAAAAARMAGSQSRLPPRSTTAPQMARFPVGRPGRRRRCGRGGVGRPPPGSRC